MTRMAAAWTSENSLPGLHRGHAGLLRGEDGVVDLALGVGEGAGDRQRAGDVGGVERVDLDAGVDEHEVALAHLAGVLDPVQGVGVVAGRADRVVADAVAAVPGVQGEGALEPALAAALLDGARAARRSSPRTRGGWRRRRPASARPRGRPCASAGARCRGPGRRRPPARPSSAAPFSTRAASRRAVSSASASRTRRTVTSPASLAAAASSSSMCRAVRPSSSSTSAIVGRAPDPELAVAGVGEELVAVAVGERAEVEHGLVAAAAPSSPVTGSSTSTASGSRSAPRPGQPGEGGVRAEDVVGVVAAHLQAAGGDDEPLPG